jgi:hypothetical protein
MTINARTSLTGLVAAIVALAAADAYATTRTVTNLADGDPGSLRATMAASAANDTINFSVTGTITLTNTAGELAIGRNLTIIGPAGGITVSGTNTHRVFNISSGITVNISNLTISNSRAIGADGANGTVLHPNGFPGGGGQGGGGFNSGTLLMTNCTFAGNSARGGKGGDALGIAGDGGAGGTGDGAALYNQGTLTLVNSTFSGNFSTGADGGVGSTGGNGGSADGGCIFNHGTLTLVNCTVSANSVVSGNGGSGDADGGNGGDSRGGGLFHDAASSSMIQNTIVAGNSATGGSGGSGGATDGANGSGFGPDVFSSGAVASLGYNLIGNATDSSGFGATGDQLNVDPKLGPLADNGGPTKTTALRVGSPAIDKGKGFGLTTDQRGQPRPYDDQNIPNATGGDGSDIGAYEASGLRMINVQKVGNHLRLDFSSGLGTNYEVQSRFGLSSGMWAPLAGSVPGNGGIANTTVTNAFNQSQQFYRVHPVP